MLRIVIASLALSKGGCDAKLDAHAAVLANERDHDLMVCAQDVTTCQFSQDVIQ